jgi:hypothetical protein
MSRKEFENYISPFGGDMGNTLWLGEVFAFRVKTGQPPQMTHIVQDSYRIHSFASKALWDYRDKLMFQFYGEEICQLLFSRVSAELRAGYNTRPSPLSSSLTNLGTGNRDSP